MKEANHLAEKILGANGGGLRKQKRVVYVRYLDHVLFKDVDPAAFSAPFIRETIGWLERENEDSIQIIWERFAGQTPDEKVRQKATGLVILKSVILAMQRLNGNVLGTVKHCITENNADKGYDHGTHVKAHHPTPERARKEGGLLRCDH